MRSRSTVISGVGALAALTSGAAAVPLLLVVVAGNPLASLTSTGGWQESLTNPIGDEFLIAALSLTCWALWALFTASVLVEAFHWARNTESRSVPLTGMLARRLILSVALLLTHTQRPTASLAEQLTPISATMPVVATETPANPSAQVDTDSIQNTVEYKVAPRDDLWSLAERHLGDPLRWRELFELNKGATQSDGRSLTSPELLRPGWVLQMPSDAVSLPVEVTDVPFNGPTTVNQESPVGKPNVESGMEEPLTEAQPEAESEPENTYAKQDVDSADTQQPQLVKWSLTASGIVLLLDQLRRRRRRHRLPGTLEATTPASLHPTEVALRVADQTSTASRLDIAARALTQCLSETAKATASVNAVRVGPDGVEFLFDAPVLDGSGPFRIDGNGQSWTLESTVHEVRVGALAAGMPSPLPALVEIGELDGAQVLIDLESHGITSIVGDNAQVLTEALVQQLSTNAWADHIEVVTVGVPAPSGLNRVRHFETLADVPSLVLGLAHDSVESLEESGYRTTFQARASMEGGDGWIPTVLFIPAALIHDDMFNEFVAVAQDGRKGLSIVVMGDCPESQRTLQTTGSGRLLISSPEMELESLNLNADDIASANELFDHVLSHESTPYTLPEVDIDLREIVDVPAPPAVSVNVLGTVKIEGGNASIERSRSVEAVVYLALHPQGVSDDKLKGALWPDRMPTPGTFNTTVSLARRQLGDDSDGVPFVLPVKRARYSVSQNVGTDFDRFEKLFALAKSTTESEATRLLGGALELVRGKPFDDVSSGYAWAHVEGFIARAEAIIADAAHLLAQIHLKDGDAATATWAARKGLLAAPGYEVLYRDLMLACEVDGNLGALETIMAELNTLLDVVDPDDSLESETTALYTRLRQRRSSVGAR
jgi:DNA-binding SARP family transcriptional activator